MTKGALLRDEFRGAHFKPECPERDDTNWLKTSIAAYDKTKDEPDFSFVPVPTPYLDPVPRDYTVATKTKPSLKNVPQNIKLPL